MIGRAARAVYALQGKPVVGLQTGDDPTRVPFEKGGPSSEYLEATSGFGFRTVGDAALCPPFYACVTVNAKTAAGLPLVAARPDSQFERVENTDLARILANPSPSIPKERLLVNTFVRLFARGSAELWIRRGSKGVPLELVPAEICGARTAGAVQLSETVDLKIPYSGKTGYVKREIPVKDVIFLHDETWDPFTGKSDDPSKSKLKNPYKLYSDLMRLYRNSLRNGGRGTIFMTLPDSAHDREQLKKDWADYGAGIDNAFTPFLMGYGGDVKSVSHTAEQQQIVEMLRRVDLEVCRQMNTDPRFIYAEAEGIKERARGTLSEAHTAWLDHGLRSTLETIAGEFTLKLAGRNRDGFFTERAVFDTSHFSMGTLKERVVVADEAVAKAPLMTPNEARKMILDLPPLEGEEYDEIWPTKGVSGDPPGRSGDAPKESVVG